MRRREKSIKEAPSRAEGASSLKRGKLRRTAAVIAVVVLSAVIFVSVFHFMKTRGPGRYDSLSGVPDVDLISVAFSASRSNGSRGMNCYLKTDEAGRKRGSGEIGRALALCLDAFMTGLQIPQDKFWVNLSYLEPRRVLDSGIADTLTGRVLLYGDLRLKQDISRLTNPALSPEGALFWTSVRKKAGELGVPDNVVVLDRVWIEPAEACVYMRMGAPCILRCSLRVCLEKPDKDGSSAGGIQDYANELFAGIILPQLNKKVNQDKAYAPLRCVYKGLVLAKAYKDSAKETTSGYLPGIEYNSGNTGLLEPCFNYSAAAIYRKYMNELKKMRSGSIQTGDASSGIAFTNYFMGGIDFRSIHAKSVDASFFTEGIEVEFNIPADVINAAGGLLALATEEISSRLRLSGVLADGSFPGLKLQAGTERLSGRIKNQRINSSGL